jgi:tetratricopeptide (TPR) repeat protein
MPPAADDLKVVGLNYVLLDDHRDAIKWLEKAVELGAKNKAAWYHLGRAYYTRSRLLEARKAFLRVLDLDPRDARAENNLGLAFESSAQPSAAIDAYPKAIGWQESSPHPSEQSLRESWKSPAGTRPGGGGGFAPREISRLGA